MKKFLKKQKGFTLIELMVTMLIFVVMTGLLLAKYGNFNQDVLLNNAAYEIALTIREAQAYAMNVQGTNKVNDQVTDDIRFNVGYGVHFDMTTAANNTVILFADINNNGRYDGEPSDTIISRSILKNGMTISELQARQNLTSANKKVDKLAITFKRPNPDANIKAAAPGATPMNIQRGAATITIMSKSEQTNQVIVHPIGRIEVR